MLDKPITDCHHLLFTHILKDVFVTTLPAAVYVNIPAADNSSSHSLWLTHKPYMAGQYICSRNQEIQNLLSAEPFLRTSIPADAPINFLGSSLLLKSHQGATKASSRKGEEMAFS